MEETKKEIETTMERIEENDEVREVEAGFEDTLADNDYIAICNSTGAEVHVYDHDVIETYEEGYTDGKTRGEKIAVVGIAAAVGAAFAIKKGISWFKNRKKKKDEDFVEIIEVDSDEKED